MKIWIAIIAVFAAATSSRASPVWTVEFDGAERVFRFQPAGSIPQASYAAETFFGGSSTVFSEAFIPFSGGGYIAFAEQDHGNLWLFKFSDANGWGWGDQLEFDGGSFSGTWPNVEPSLGVFQVPEPTSLAAVSGLLLVARRRSRLAR